jgi:hypothetical protein
MPLHEIIQAAKVFSEDLRAASGFIGSLTAFWVVAESTIERLAKEKIFAF